MKSETQGCGQQKLCVLKKRRNWKSEPASVSSAALEPQRRGAGLRTAAASDGGVTMEGGGVGVETHCG